MASMDCHEHAVEAYDEAYPRTQPDKRYEILAGRAYNKHCIGDYIGAIDDLTEMITFQPKDAQLYIRRGITRAKVADYQSAIDDFDKAAEISGFDADQTTCWPTPTCTPRPPINADFCRPQP